MKAITFIYGIFCYVCFLVAFLYAAGFVGDILVPKAINDGVEIANVPALLINLLLLSVFAVQHSLMARPVFKEWWIKIVGKAAERSTYVLFSSLALGLVFWQWQPMTSIVWEVQNEIIRNLLYGIYGLGWVIVLLSSFMINHFDLLGLKQVYENLVGKTFGNDKFKVNYLYQLVRHPLMLGFLIAFWATPTMTVGHLLFTVTCTLYIYIAVKFLEEKDLKKIHGDRYREYQRTVPMLIPFTKLKTSN